ncbi:MAG: hypothetical protein ISR96_03635 [Nitrospira sp.]|nr:hypothetical protein [bacterium]MBL7048607.1 hypothetical protein [Nitrospira sp.]
MPIYPLGTIMGLVESVSTGTVPMKVSYAYEDIVFMEHNAFLLQFTAKADKILLHKNIEADIDEIKDSIAALKSAAADKEITISEGGFYSITQGDAANINLKFFKKHTADMPEKKD